MTTFPKRATDILVLAVLLIAAPVISLSFRTSLLVSIFLFYGLPSIWLSFRLPTLVKRTAFFSVLGALVFFVVDYVAVSDNAWFVSTIFPYRFLGVLPIEDSIWFFMGVYLIVLFYEYFEDHGPHRIKKTKLTWLVGIIVLMFIAFFTLLFAGPQLLVIHYAYLWLGIVFALLPSVIISWMYPHVRFKFLRANFYMIGLHLPFELVALRLGLWSFPGHNFIGWVQLAGVQFPLEEFLVYIATAGITLLAYYEFYADDGK